MKNKISLGLFTLVLAAIISSCSTSIDVASNRKIQKRKYNKGFFVSDNNAPFNRKKDNRGTITIKAEEFLTKEAKTDDELSKKTIKTDASKIVEITNTISSDLKISTEVNVNENTIATFNSNIEKTDKNNSIKVENNKEGNNVKTSKIENNSNSSKSDLMFIVLVILAIILPPLAVFLYEGITERFWIDLILAVLAISGFILLGGLAGLAGLIAVVYALLIVLEVI
jgi:uncharacterized membrane protein YqaE (UPF0057 family)